MTSPRRRAREPYHELVDGAQGRQAVAVGPPPGPDLRQVRARLVADERRLVRDVGLVERRGARQLCGLERVPVAPRGSRVALDVEEAVSTCGASGATVRKNGTGCRRRLDEPLGLARVDVGLVVAVRVTPSVQLTGDHLLPAVHLAGLGRRTPPVEAGRLIRRVWLVATRW